MSIELGMRPKGGHAKRVAASSLRSRMDKSVSPYIYIAPFFVLFAIFGLFPLGYTAWVSLHDWQLAGDSTFVGLDNFAALFADPDFWNAVANTLGMFVVASVPQLLIALLLASLLNRPLRGLTFLRMGVLAPMITSIAAVAIVFSQLFSRDAGLANWMIGLVGVEPIDWQADKWSSWTAIAVMVDWRWTGYNALIYLAAMQTIPRDVYEAAELDGASKARQFWRITIPMIKPAVIFTVIMSTIGGMQLFTEPLLFGQGELSGGSLRQFQTVAMYMFQQAFEEFDYGYGSAVAWMIFILIVLVALVNFLVSRRMSGVDK
ncbi:sugar ABC transporter permease [Nonomuraea sp. NPDC049152]|uniref:carbohydrate ABC transporter permease n=1 Tax=Nonomuraea sp. NPDC049152 TaxID=3154350 RepID=UPI0033D64A99